MCRQSSDLQCTSSTSKEQSLLKSSEKVVVRTVGILAERNEMPWRKELSQSSLLHARALHLSQLRKPDRLCNSLLRLDLQHLCNNLRPYLQHLCNNLMLYLLLQYNLLSKICHLLLRFSYLTDRRLKLKACLVHIMLQRPLL